MNVALAAVVAAPGLVIGSFLNVVASRVPERRGLVLDRLGVHELRHADRGLGQHPAAVVRAAPRPLPQLQGGDPDPLPGRRGAHGRADRGLRASLRARRPRRSWRRSSAPCSSRSRRSTSSIASSRTGSCCRASSSCSWHRPRSSRAPSGRSGPSAPPGSSSPPPSPIRSGMGMGDVKLALLLGAMLGRNVAVGLMLGLLFALVPAAILALRHGTQARKMAHSVRPVPRARSRRGALRRRAASWTGTWRSSADRARWRAS